MRTQSGEHPRVGAMDVCPFVPVSGITMDECAELARVLGARVGEELGIPVYLYEEGIIDWQDTATTEEFYLYSAMDKDYTVRASYNPGNQTIMAFDGDKMTLYDAGEECGSPCYIVKGGIFDVRLAK